jgi:hypothetical protein
MIMEQWNQAKEKWVADRARRWPRRASNREMLDEERPPFVVVFYLLYSNARAARKMLSIP